MTEPEATKSGLYPSPLTPRLPLPEAGRGGENALRVTQIYWDFESCVLRNVGKDEANIPGLARNHRRVRSIARQSEVCHSFLVPTQIPRKGRGRQCRKDSGSPLRKSSPNFCAMAPCWLGDW